MTTPKLTPSIEYHGQTITLRMHRDTMDFLIDGPLFGEGMHDRTHGSVEQAKEAIDKAHRAQNAATKEKLNLLVYNADGEDAVITGIHAGNGTLTGVNLLKENQGSYRGQVVYPRAAWIKAAIERSKELLEEHKVLHERLRLVEIDCKRSSWGRPEPTAIPRMIANLHGEYKDACAKADKPARAANEAR